MPKVFEITLWAMIKKLTLWILGLLLVQPIVAQQLITSIDPLASRKRERNLFKGILIAGFNAAQIDGDNVGGYYYFGAQVGAGTIVRFHPRVSMSMELLYNMKGSRSRLSLADVAPRDLKVITDYIDVPIAINIHDKKVVMFTAGLSVGALMRYKEYEAKIGESVMTDVTQEKETPLRIGLEAFAGMSFIIRNVVGINPRFAYSILPIRDAEEGSRLKHQRHNYMSLRAFYIIGNRPSSKPAKQ
jgi:hypothetical protein